MPATESNVGERGVDCILQNREEAIVKRFGSLLFCWKVTTQSISSVIILIKLKIKKIKYVSIKLSGQVCAAAL